MPLTFIVNTHGLFLWKTNKVLQLWFAIRILDVSNHKPNKIRLDKGNDLYNKSMESWLQIISKCIQHIMKENMLFLQDLLEPEEKNKIYKYMTSV